MRSCSGTKSGNAPKASRRRGVSHAGARRSMTSTFHDLRREAGSRWLEGGVPLQTVRDWLGHANISQTSTYLDSTLKGQHEAMRRFEEERARRLSKQPSTGDAETVQAGATPGAEQGSDRPQLAGPPISGPSQTVN